MSYACPFACLSCAIGRGLHTRYPVDWIPTFSYGSPCRILCVILGEIFDETKT